jgi:hypothetical protein
MCQCQCGWTVKTNRAVSVKCPQCSGVIICDGAPRPKTIVVRKIGKWVRYVKLLRKPEDKGVGDTVQRIASKFGGERFKAWAKRLGIPCGCAERQEMWNRIYPYG